MSTDLITDHLDLWTSAVTYNRGEPELTGIAKLRELILELAVRGKLVPQDPEDEPAAKLLERIEGEKARLHKEGKIKKPKKLPEVEEDEKPFEVPQGWEWARLGEIGQVIGGGTPKSGEPSFWSEEGVKWLTPADLYGFDQKYISSGRRDISQEGLEKSSATLMPAGSVLFSSRAPIGYVAIAGSPLSTNQGFKSCVPYVEGMSEYLFYFLKRSAGLVHETASGTTFKEISGSKMAQVLVALPPQGEQGRIVEKVDELMDLCDRLEQQASDQLSAHETLVDTLLETLTRSQDATELADNWARLAEHFDTLFTTEDSIDRLEQTILQLAIMGRLVPQDPNDEPASKLLERIEAEKERLYEEGKIKKPKKLPEVQEGEKEFPLPENWVWARLADIYDVRDGTHDTPKYYENGYPLITSKNLSSGELDFSNVKYIREKDHIEICKRSKVDYGDILFAMIGSIGNPVVVNTDKEFSIKNVALFKCYSPEVYDKGFLHKLLIIKGVSLKDKSSGGVQSFVSLGKIRSEVVGVPPLSEQQRISEKVDELQAICERLRSRLNEAGNTQQRFAESIVKQAVA
jgi:type I restriction enzyme S subunit